MSEQTDETTNESANESIDDRNLSRLFLSFGSNGTRNCIGTGFALMQSKIILVRLLNQFHLELVDSSRGRIVPEIKFNLKPKLGIQVKVKERAIKPSRMN